MDLLEKLWRVLNADGKTFLEETRAVIRGHVRRFHFRDPEGASSDAMLHLIEMLEHYLPEFLNPDGSFCMPRLRSWRRTVIHNHLLRLIDEGPVEGAEELEAAPPGEDNQSPDKLVAEYEELLRLFWLLSQLRNALQVLALTELSGFSRDRIGSRLGYTPGSCSVMWCRVKEDLRQGSFRDDPLPLRERIFDLPSTDVPLGTNDTPLLMTALLERDGEAGARLVDALANLEPGRETRFLARIAGFWDCVIATVRAETLFWHRSHLRSISSHLERRLEAKEGSPPQPRRPASSADRPHPHTLCGGSHMSLRAPLTPSLSAHLDALDKFLLERPDHALEVLLDSPRVHSGLARGRQRQTPERVGSLTSAMHTALEEVRRWFYPPLQAALRGPSAVRQEEVRWLPASEVRLPDGTRLLALSLRGDAGERADQHCFLWHVGPDLPHPQLLYPRFPGESTLGAEIDGMRALLPMPPEGAPAHLELFWIKGPLPAGIAHNPYRHQRELQRWLEACTAEQQERVSRYRFMAASPVAPSTD